MNKTVAGFIQTRHIDSFQKLRLVLFLHQHPGLSGTSQEFASRLYSSDAPLMEGIITDLHLAGLLDCVEGRFKLRNDSYIRSCLGCLVRTFEDPLDRQGILDKVTRCEYPGRYLENAYEFR